MGPYLFDAARHVPVMIYPNPLNPGKYVVINSGFTFRGFGSNATQVPRLPDYAVIDARTRASEDRGASNWQAFSMRPGSGGFDEKDHASLFR